MSTVESKSSKRSRQSSIVQEVDLHVTNPELFTASPRPGGFLKIRVPPRGEEYDYNLSNKANNDESEECHCSSDPNICINTNKAADENIMLTHSRQGQPVKLPNLPTTTPGREFRLRRAVESNDWTIKGIDETNTMIEISNPIQDTMNMLAVTISTIMMLAAQVPGIEDVYLDWATLYLSCIVDENDEDLNRPPNVQALLNHIMLLKMGGKVSDNDSNPPGSKSSKGSPPSSMKKGADNPGAGSIAGGSAGGGSGTRGGSAGGGSGTRGGTAVGGSGTRGGSPAGGSGSRGGSPGGGSAAGVKSTAKGVSISEVGGKGGTIRSNPTIKSR